MRSAVFLSAFLVAASCASSLAAPLNAAQHSGSGAINWKQDLKSAADTAMHAAIVDAQVYPLVTAFARADAAAGKAGSGAINWHRVGHDVDEAANEALNVVGTAADVYKSIKGRSPRSGFVEELVRRAIHEALA